MNLHVSIRNFRSIKSTDLDIKSGVNILIGPNGSGKTTIFLALKFLRDVIFRGAGLAVARSGGTRRTFRRGENEISFVVEASLGGRVYRRKRTPFQLRWEIHISKKGKEETAVIVRERISILAIDKETKQTVFDVLINRSNFDRPTHKLDLADTKDVGKDLFSTMYMDSPSRTKAEALADTKAEFELGLKQIKKTYDRAFFPHIANRDYQLRAIYSAFQNLNEYNILPDIARQSTDQLPFAEMLPNGKNLSEVIYALERRNFHRITDSKMYEEDFIYSYGRPRFGRDYSFARRTFLGRKPIDLKEAFDNINKELAAAVTPIESVAAQIDQTNGKRFVIFNSGKYTFFPEEVSDGTIKWLCILVSLYVPFSIIYLLEEPENFLHPWMQQRLISVMREQSRINKTIFLLTTHSATILNAAVPNEVIMVKASKKGTVASSIKDKEEIEEALKDSNFGLGDLWVSGAIGAVPGENE